MRHIAIWHIYRRYKLNQTTMAEQPKNKVLSAVEEALIIVNNPAFNLKAYLDPSMPPIMLIDETMKNDNLVTEKATILKS